MTFVTTSNKSKFRVRDAGNFLTITEYERPLKYDKKRIDILTGEFLCNKKNLKDCEFFDLITEDLEIKRNDDLHRVQNNFNKRRDNFIDLVSANIDKNTYFLTLTYDNENVKFFNDYELLKIDWLNFSRRLERFLKRSLNYICVPELQEKRSAWHLHIILFDFLRVDVLKIRELWGFGAVNIKKVNILTTGVAKYLALYLGTYRNDLFSKNKKSYWTSRFLKKPFVYYQMPSLIDYRIEKIEKYNSNYFGNCKKTIYVKKI